MKTIAQLTAGLIRQHGNANRLAKAHGLRQATVQRWAKGLGAPDDALCPMFAKEAGVPLELVLVLSAYAREKDRTLRSAWKRAAIALGGE